MIERTSVSGAGRGRRKGWGDGPGRPRKGVGWRAQEHIAMAKNAAFAANVSKPRSRTILICMRSAYTDNRVKSGDFKNWRKQQRSDSPD